MKNKDYGIGFKKYYPKYYIIGKNQICAEICPISNGMIKGIGSTFCFERCKNLNNSSNDKVKKTWIICTKLNEFKSKKNE